MRPMILLGTAGMLAGPAAADDCDPHYLGFGGAAYSAMDVHGDTAYGARWQLSGFPYFSIEDVSDPAQPELIGELVTTYSNDLEVSGSHAYLVGDNLGGPPTLAVIDVSDPADPFFVGSYEAPDGPDWAAAGIDVAGDRAYVGTGDRLIIIDVSDPTAPSPIATHTLAKPAASSVEVVGTIAYVGMRGDGDGPGLEVVDVADAGAPVGLGTIGDYAVESLIVSDGLLFASVYTESTAGFRVFDLAEPAVPGLLGAYDTEVAFGPLEPGIALAGDLAILSQPVMQLVDVSDPSAPVLIGTYDDPSSTEFVGVIEHVAYLGVWSGNEAPSVSLLDISSCLRCPADANDDGALDVLDFVAFQLLWQDGDQSADCDADGGFTVLDFDCFQQLFTEGCP